MDCNTLAGGQCPTRFHLAGHMNNNSVEYYKRLYQEMARIAAENKVVIYLAPQEQTHMSDKPDNTKIPTTEKSESTELLENAAWARMYGIRAGWLWVEGRRTTLRALLEDFPEADKYHAVKLWQDDTVRPIMEKAFQRVKSNVVE